MDAVYLQLTAACNAPPALFLIAVCSVAMAIKAGRTHLGYIQDIRDFCDGRSVCAGVNPRTLARVYRELGAILFERHHREQATMNAQQEREYRNVLLAEFLKFKQGSAHPEPALPVDDQAGEVAPILRLPQPDDNLRAV